MPVSFPRLYAAASLKRYSSPARPDRCGGFPRLYAAASLKRKLTLQLVALRSKFSAALCRGLIEAR